MARNKKHNASVAAAVSVSFFAFSSGVLAAPTGGTVARGSAEITQSALQTLITQTTDKAVINWQDFNIDAAELVKFVQNNSSSVALNRVTGDTVSQIQGALTANGNIFLLNPNGIMFGSSASVDVAGLVASTFDIADQDFMDGKFNFTGDMMSSASISNDGELKVGDGGFVYLIAPNVENTGHIIANVGSVTLGSDGTYNIDLAGNGLIKFEVSNATLNGATSSVENSGDITADHVLLSGSQTREVMSSVVNTGDITAATELTMAGDTVEQSGTVNAQSTIVEADQNIVSSGGSISGSSATLKAGNNIGTSSQSLYTNVDSLSVENDSGNAYVGEADGLNELNVATGGNAYVSLNTGDDDIDTSNNASVNLADNILTTSGTVTGQVGVTEKSGGITLDSANVDGDLSVTAAGVINGAGNVVGDARANHLSLNTTVEGASIGGENNPLRIDADTLSASANKGHIVISDTAGDVALERITTGDNSAEAGLRAIINAEDGNLTGVVNGGPNVEAWATNLKADGSIGSAGHAVTTAVDVLSASTQDGGININDVDGELVVNSVTAGERITVGGQTVSSSAISNGEGEVTLSNGAVGSHDVSIGAESNMLLTGAVNATGDLSLESRDGGIYTSGDNVLLTGRELNLNTAGRIGQQGVGALKTQSNSVNARSGQDGVYLSEGVGLTIGSILAEGDNNNVEVTATQGDITLGTITAIGGDVTATAGQGAIKGDSSLLNVEADTLSLDAKGAIGSAANRLRTDVHSLTSVTATNLAGTYVTNLGPLERLNITTLDGNASISDSDGNLTFTGNNDNLNVQRSGQGLDLDFTNNAGGLVLNGVALEGHDVALTASGGISETAGLLSADSATLNAGKGIELTTNVSNLEASAADGDIGINNSAYTGTLTFKANADRHSGDGDVQITQGGDLLIDEVKATGTVSLSAEGSINGSGDGNAVIAKNLDVRGEEIGSENTAFTTNVNGNLFADAGASSLYLSNLGSLTLLGAEADGDINLTQNGDVILDALKAGGDVVFSASGRVSDGNGNSLNISGQRLTMDAQQIGQRDGVTDALELNVDELMLDVSNGGIFVRNLNGDPLNLVRANAAGGDINIETAGDLDLGTVKSAGNTVTLASGGAVEDARPNGSSTANVQAKRVNISGEDGVGANGALSLDVSYLSVAGGDGDVNAINMGAVAVDSESLVGKGASGVTIVATTVTILDNNGGVITLDGGKLVLTATNGNIVFLNQDDTIMLPGGGSITLTARADADREGYNGNIIAGNLTTQGGNISLDADTNITFGMLDTGGNGDVSVTARNGVIMDGNGSDANIRGDQVKLTANTPSLRDAELVRETAVADYAGRVAELNAKILQFETLEQQLQSYISMLQGAIVQQGLTQYNLNVSQSQVNSLSAQVASAEQTLNALASALSIATVVRNAVAIGAGAAQAIPFSGDAGADAAFAVVDLALSAADTALDSFERYSFAPKVDELNELFNDLDVAKAFNQDAISNVQIYTNLRNTLQVSRDTADQSVFSAQVARDASEALRKQAIGAYDQNQDIDFSVEKPLGVEANRLDIGTTSGRAINSAVYLESNGSLGLGDIESNGEIHVKNVAGDISVVGDVVSPSMLTLQADGAVRGIGGTWENGVWTPEAGQLTAALIAVRAGDNIGSVDHVLHTNTGEIAAHGGLGDVYIVNDNGGNELVVGTVDGISGVQSDGDIGIKHDGDLRLKTQIRDADGSSDNNAYLIAAGRIVDDNGETLNVTARDLYFQAGGDVELDTAVDRLMDGKVTGKGDITVRDQGDLNIVDLATTDGGMSVSATGAMLLETLSAGGDDGDITLSAEGNIDDDQDNTTRISGKTLAMTATGGAIGATGDNQHRALDTSVDSVSASANGEVNIDDSDDLEVTRVATSTGDITLISQIGDLHLGEVRTDGDGNTITLQAAGAIDALNEADDTAELHATNLALRAGNGIGDGSQSLLAEASALEADAGNGGLYITNRNNDLTIGGVTPNLGLTALSGLDANGDIRLEVTDGSLTINDDVTQTGVGDTDLYSNGDMTVNAGMQAAGNLQMLSGANLSINGQTLTADGNLVGQAEDDVTLAANSQLNAGHGLGFLAGDTINAIDSTLKSGTASGLGEDDIDDLLLLTQSGDITLTNTTGSAAGGIQVGAGMYPDIEIGNNRALAPAPSTGDVTLTHSTLDAQGDDLVLGATGDITLNSGTQASTAQDLNAQAGGDITVTNSDLNANRDMDLLAGGLLQLSTATLSSGVAPMVRVALAPTPEIGDMTLTSNTGDIVLTNGTRLQSTGETTLDAQAASIEVNNSSSVTAATDVTLKANNDINLSSSANLQASNGDLAMSATAGDITLTNSARASAAGELTGTAGQGITVTNGSSLKAGTDMSLDAQGADLTLDNGSNATAAADLTMGAKGSVTVDHSAFAEATGGDLSLTATDGDITLTNGTHASAAGELTGTAGQGIAVTNGAYLQAGKDLSITATEGDAALSNGGRVTAGGTLTAYAGDNIILTDAMAISGAHDVGDPAPAWEDAGMALTADKGDITLTRSQARSGGDLTGSAGQNIGFTDADATAAGAATLTAGTDEDNGTGADIALDNSHVTANGTAATLTAADSISLQRASTVVAHDDLTVDALAGDLTLIQTSTLAAQTGQMDLDAGNSVSFTDSSATAAQAMTIDATVADIALNNSHATAGTDLSLSAGSDITLTDSDDPNSTGSNLLAQAGDLSLIASDNIALDSASSGVANGDVTANAEAGDLTVIEHSKLLAQTGKMDLNVGNRVGVTDSTLNAASDLTVEAVDADIALDNSHATAGDDLAMTAGTDVTLVNGSHADANTGNISITGIIGDVALTDSVANAHGMLDLSAGDNVVLTRSNATSGDDMTLTGTVGDVTLSQSQATTGADLTGTAGQNLGMTDSSATAYGNATLAAGTDEDHGADADLTLANSHVNANGGNATLSAADSIGLQGASTVVARDNLSAAALAGDLTLIENSLLNAKTGQMELDAGQGVAITDSTLVSATDLTATADGTDIAFDNSHATAQSGDATLTAAKGISLTRASTIAAHGDLSADAQAADLTLDGNSSLAAQTGQMDLDAGNAIAFTDSSATAAKSMTVDASDAGIALNNSHATAGTDLSMDAGSDITLSQSDDLNTTGSSVSAQTGDLKLTAGDNIALDSASSGMAHGNVTVNAESGDLTVTEQSSLTAQTGKMDLDAAKRVAVTDSVLSAATGMTVDAAAADIDLDNATAIAGTDMAMSAATDVSLENSNVQATSGDLSLTGTDGNIAATNSLVEAGNDVSVNAGEDIAFVNSDATAQSGQMDLDAGNAIAFTDSSATAAKAMTLDASDANIAFDNSQATAGTDLSLDADTDITLSQSSTTATAGNLNLSAGDNIALKNASSGMAHGNVTVNAESGDLTVTAQSSLTAQTGKMDLDAARRVAVTDSVLSAATGMTVDAAAAVIDLDNATAIAGTDMAMSAATDVSLDNSNVQATSGDLSLTGTDGNIAATNSLVEAGNDVSVNAGEDIAFVNSDATAQSGQMDLDAGNAIAFTDSSATAAKAMSLDASDANIAFDNSQATAGADLSMTAATDVTLDSSNVQATNGDLSLIGTDGNIDLTDSNATAGTGMDLHAGNSVAMTGSEATAGAAVSMTADAADILLDDSNVTAATDLTLNADGDIILTDTSNDGDSVGSTVTAQAGDLSLTAGSDITLDSASHGTGHSDVSASAEQGDLRVIEQSTLLAQTGRMDLYAGNAIAFTDSSATAEKAMSLDASAAGIGLNNSQATAGTNLSMTAATDVSLTDTVAQAGNGDLSLVASSGDIDLTRGSATAQGNMGLSAGGAINQADHNLTATTGTLAMAALNGAIAQSGSSTASAAGAVGLDAVNGVKITHLASDSDLTVNGGQGGIDMATGSLVAADGDVTMTTDGDINLTRSQAGGDVTLTSNMGGINASDAVSENVTGQNLFLSTARSIGSALSGLKTRVGNLYATITGSGDLYMVEADALTVKDAKLANGDAHLTTGDDLNIDNLAVKGDTVLNSAGVISTGVRGSLSADDLTASAVDGIDLNANLASASLNVSGSGDIDLTNQNALALNQASTVDGDINVDAGGDLGIGRVAAPGEHRVRLTSGGAIAAAGEGSIDSRNVALNAINGIGANGALSLNAADLTAMTNNGDIRLDQTGNVALNTLRTGDGEIAVAVHGGDATLGDIRADGDVSLSAADGGLANDNDATTHVRGDSVTLASANGIGAGGAIDTRANRIDASVSGDGDIDIAERDGLAGLDASAANGNVKVSTATGNLTVNQVKALSPGNAVMLFAEGGSILDGNGDANNIVASLLRIAAAQGIARASDPLDVRVSSLAANGGSGGVYINNGSSDPLTVFDLIGKGNIGLTTDGDLNLPGTVNGGGVSLRAGGDVVQEGDIFSASYASVYGEGDVTMTSDAQTFAITNVEYHAGDVLTVNEITTSSKLTGGLITLEGNSLKSNADSSGSLDGSQVQFNLTSPQDLDVGYLVKNASNDARISVNGRTLGGKFTEDSQFVADLIFPSTVFPHLIYQNLTTPSSLGFQQDSDNEEEWHFSP